ncbi:enoyl-CoA hydratase/isomerase family protein [Actinosynnema pretiosum subsp. pretiosum]|uniref:Enoyl-CoA hydratase/isomerase n=2 Tax=Actinosynnema TaxID=40566 RepID=C6W8A6_ACTMD|nr:enoyl-CoA hydratase/isomerase family protein [Actinosynnema mirum]ACU38953.1 Enoyl-CoA hydratase/isomerase [Actinosynnema mirum DSM 43827]QUF03550.1 enoyl-CoA hydratase/isomerase family protein [Actinosynnema pretiosum subsp. pretiosum]
MSASSAVDADLLERGGVRLVLDGPRATIVLERPDVLNAQTPSTWEALRHIGEKLGPDVRVVVVRGSGRAFSAGLDRRLFTGDHVDGEPGLMDILQRGPEGGAALIASFQEGFRWLRSPERVTVAAVRGHAIGAGFQLALACDFRVAAEDARFRMAETSLGLVPDLGGTLPLVRLVGYSRAAEICLSGRKVGATEALAMGLVNAVVPVDGLDAAVDDLVAAVTLPLPGATRETLALLAAAADGASEEEQLRAEREAQLRRLADLAALARS